MSAAEAYAATRTVLQREEELLRQRLIAAEAKASLEPDADEVVAELETIMVLLKEWPGHAASVLAAARDALDAAAEALVDA